MIVIVGAIVAAAAFAVYLLSGLNDAPPSKLGGIENFIPAREGRHGEDVGGDDAEAQAEQDPTE